MASTDTTPSTAAILRQAPSFDGRFGFGFGPVYPYYGYYPPANGYEGSCLLVLLPELRGVLPERGELPGGVGARTGFINGGNRVTFVDRKTGSLRGAARSRPPITSV